MSLLLDTLQKAESQPPPPPAIPVAPESVTPENIMLRVDNCVDLFRLPQKAPASARPPAPAASLRAIPPRVPQPTLPGTWRPVSRSAFVHGVFLTAFLLAANPVEEPSGERAGIPGKMLPDPPSATLACLSQPKVVLEDPSSFHFVTPAETVASATPPATVSRNREMPPLPPQPPARFLEPNAHSATLATLHSLPRIAESAPTPALLRPAAQAARYLFLSNQAPALSQARKALLSGDAANARQHYETALQLDPRNPAALAGAAALAIRDRKPDKARSLYQELLRSEPQSSLALAGINSLDPSTETGALEQHLGQLSANSRDALPLRFVLGTKTAARHDWSAARNHFREALKIAANQPELHVNLAIALDHLGESRAALEHYREALRLLTPRGWHGFDPEPVRRRVSLLESAPAGS
ncbi:MAG: tetratricopeptide repeat protein [Magnetococcales bacterium]|nr:tetratricopeptide repeat protein [Magnetococcales bacterium]